MIRVLHIVGALNGWAIQKRAEALIQAMEADVEGTMVSYKNVTTDTLKTSDFIHVHGLQILPLLRNRMSGVDTPYGFEVVSERSLKSVGDAVVWMRKARACWCKNPRLVNLICPHVVVNPIYIPNGVDTELFHPKPVHVGWVGNKRDERHLEYKGVPLIEKAVQLLNAKGGHYRFTTDPSHYPRLIPQRELVGYYQSLDVLVCASKAEGCSNVVNEALACGVPVVSTSVGISPELEQKHRLVCVSRTVKGIAKGIEMMAGFRLKRSETMVPYQWESAAVAGKYLESYKEAIS